MTPVTSCSDTESRWDVASSRIRMLGIADDRAGDRNPLALAARNHCTALTDQRVEARRQRRHHSSDWRPRSPAGGGRGHMLPAVEDVVAERAEEQEGILLDHRGRSMPALGGKLPVVMAVHRDASSVGARRRSSCEASVDLPEPDLPDDRDGLTRREP